MERFLVDIWFHASQVVWMFAVLVLGLSLLEVSVPGIAVSLSLMVVSRLVVMDELRSQRRLGA